MAEAASPEKVEYEISPEGQLFFDLVKFPDMASEPSEQHRVIMEAIFAECPELLARIVETLSLPGLPERQRRRFKIVDELYGVTRDKKTVGEIAREERVTKSRVWALRKKGLRDLRNAVIVETVEGNFTLNRLIIEKNPRLTIPVRLII